MRTACLLVVLLVSLIAWPALCSGATYVMSDFETDPDLLQWSGTDGATLSRVASHPTSGSYSCQMHLPTTTYPGMMMTSLPITDWSAYDVLRMDFYNPESFAIVLHLEISDSVQGSSWNKRYYAEKAIIPGINQIQIDLHTMTRVDGTGNVDIANIDRFTFYLTGFSSTTDVYCDYVRLETVQDDPYADAASNIWKFDFGTSTSPRWPDFFRVTHTSTYPVNAETDPYGWTDSNPRYSGDSGGPDDLGRDWVRGIPCCPDDGLDIDFRVDLPNGDYTVYVIARSGELHGMPVLPWQISAEGVEKVNVAMDSVTFFSESYYYRGMGDDYPLAASYWDTYEAPNLPAYSFTTTVSDGSLDLDFNHAWVFMLVVYPTSLNTEMATRIADWTSERKAQFEANYYVNSPEDLTFTPTAEESTRGYAAWPVAAMDPCYPDTLPPDPRPAISLSTSACQNEYRAVDLAIRPLSDITAVSVEVTDLSDGQGHTIASSEIELQYVRYLATPDTEFFGTGVLSWKPRLLQTDFPLDVKQQVTKQFWLTVHVPDATPSGTYTGTVTVRTSAGDLAVPLSVTVWPFSLDSADDMAYGWYYMSPAERYCYESGRPDKPWFPDLAGAADDMLRLDFAHMKKHGFNSLQFPSPSASDFNSGTGHIGSLDFSTLERYVAAMEDTGFGGNWTGQVGTIGLANAILWNSSVSEFDSNFDAAFKDALSRIIAWGNTDGVPLVMYLVDEPRETGIQSWNRNFADSMEYCGLANEVPDCVSTITVMADSGSGVDYTPFADVLDIMQTHPWPLSAGLISQSIAQGKPNWFYNTGGDLQFVYGLYQYKYGNGCWEWHYDWLDGDLFDSFPYSPFNNHWHYTYPSPNGPVATLSYELASQGITDYRYAATLDRLSSQARACGLPEFVAWADQADALLQDIKDDVPQYAVDASYRAQHFAGIADAPGCLTLVDEAIADYRGQIATLIMALPGPIPGPDCAVVSSSLPTTLEWERSGDVSVTVRNLTSGTWTPAAGYQLRAGSGVDRWGIISLPITSDVAQNAIAAFNFSVFAPPITTVSYPIPVSDTTPGEAGGLACSWSMSQNTDALAGGTASEDVVISRFPDVQLGTTGEWARFWIEECAGRVPVIVGGYEEPDGSKTYRPTGQVDRASMAVFLARALQLPTAPYAGNFPGDVPSSHWAWPWIEALAEAGIVNGVTPTHYMPESLVTREGMAVFVARGMWGGTDVPTGPATPTFTDDVPLTNWAYDEIEYCVALGVVRGVDATHYFPLDVVNRAQMAVFVYKAFIMPTGAAVVLGGPAVTAVDPDTAGYWGWSSLSSAPSADPGYAYVLFDAVRLHPDITGPDSFFDVFFELRGPVTATGVAQLSAADISDANTAATASGIPYCPVAWDIDAGLPAGDYTLVVSVEDKTGAVHQITRQPVLTITP